MTPEKFSRMFLALDIPLSEEEWYGLNRIFEKLRPGITACLAKPKARQPTVEADAGSCAESRICEEFERGECNPDTRDGFIPRRAELNRYAPVPEKGK